MSLSRKDLQSLWKKEQEEYRRQEVGSGVQRFVKEVLKSAELFNLKEGKLATSDESRQAEFLEEKPKLTKRADIIIFVDSARIIPIEVERFGNIAAGLQQLFNYQHVWEKKYGILTDGFTWQFFNNTFLIKSFNIISMLTNTDEFLDFWNEYIQIKNYYIQFFENIGQVEMYSEDFSVANNRRHFFDDTTTLIKSFKNKLNLKGYFSQYDSYISEKKSVEITYAYLIQFILYKTLVDNEYQRFKDDFTKRLNRVFKNLKGGSYSDILTAIKSISELISRNIYRPFAQEQEIINIKLNQILSMPENELTDVTPWLDIFIYIKRYNFANVRNEIFGYIYENFLKDIYEEEKKGQYFTDPAVVNFMLEQVGYDSSNIGKLSESELQNISLIDPSCGSGTFLYSAVRNIIESRPNGSFESSKNIEQLISNNIFGLDIEEFPIYLAEMSILMRLLPLIINENYNNPMEKKIKVFKTKDSVAEFLDTAIRNTQIDENIEIEKNGKGQMVLFQKEINLGYPSHVRDEDDLNEMKNSLEYQPRIPRFRFDFVVGNPPYISYNESSKQDILFFKLIKECKVKLNNVYGVNLHSIPGKPKKYRPNPNLYAFFLALGLALLKEDGRLCYIIPQTLLTAGDLDVLRFHLSKFATIEKIITFNCNMFVRRGLKQNKVVPTSSLIIVIKRSLPIINHEVDIVNYTKSDEDVNTCIDNITKEVEIDRSRIRQSLLLESVENWNIMIKNISFAKYYHNYKEHTNSIAEYYLHDLAEKTYHNNYYFDSGYGIDEKMMMSSRPSGKYFLFPRLNVDFWTIVDQKGYWPDVRDSESEYKINLRQANQGYSLLDSDYKIIWSYMNPKKFHFTDKPIIWPRNQICAIGSDDKPELLYLFALLNSPINFNILEMLLTSENEKNFQVPTMAIKDFARIPKITADNKMLKDEIIRLSSNLLNLENWVISHFVDFGSITMQKIDDIYFSDNDLILRKGDKDFPCPIKDKISLVKECVHSSFSRDLAGIKSPIDLFTLQNTRVVDRKKQGEIKDRIDHLVFALYFIDFKITSQSIKYAELVALCRNNKYFRYLALHKK